MSCDSHEIYLGVQIDRHDYENDASRERDARERIQVTEILPSKADMDYT